MKLNSPEKVFKPMRDLGIGMTVKVLNFSALPKAFNAEDKGFIVKKPGTAYVVAVTREKCSGCEKQKPLFEKLSDKMQSKHGDKVEFLRVHSDFSSQSKEEAARCLEAFQTVAFPTYMIYVKDHQGKGRETYRSIEPPMSEIERNIGMSVELAGWFDAKKQ